VITAKPTQQEAVVQLFMPYKDKLGLHTPPHQKRENAKTFSLLYDAILSTYVESGLILEKVLYCFVRNHLLIEDVCAGFRALNHFDNLGISTSVL
jgi:hypothetical protein